MTYSEAIKEIEDALLYNGINNPITDRAIDVLKKLVEGSNCDAE
jgi:hypothetical protein